MCIVLLRTLVVLIRVEIEMIDEICSYISDAI